MKTVCAWLWSIHLPRTAVDCSAAIGSISNVSRYFSFNRSGTPAIMRRLPSKYFRWSSMSALHRPSAFRSRTRWALTTVNSPLMLALT
jgi:hypothetical protein